MGLRGREVVRTGCSPGPRGGPAVSLVLVHVLLSHTLLQSQPWASGTGFLQPGGFLLLISLLGPLVGQSWKSVHSSQGFLRPGRRGLLE